jgi:uncharacterized membrane protein YkvI
MQRDPEPRIIEVVVRPTKAGSIALIVLPTLFLAFCVALFASVWSDAEDARPAMAVFAGIWCVANLGLAGYGAYNLLHRGAG